MENKTSDFEIVAALRAVAQHGSARKAGLALGLHRTTINDYIKKAAVRGLTIDTQTRDPLQAARIEIVDLKRQLAQQCEAEDTAARIREEIHKIAAHDPDPPKWLVAPGKNGFRGIPTCFASDWHHGEVVQPKEVNGLNQFNAEISKKRVERMATRCVDLCFNHMGRAETVYPGIVLALGGDMISGDIHQELMATNDRTPQQAINDVTDMIGGVIELFATKFGNVFVPAVTGNHGRATMKPRFKGRVFTSHEWNIYCNLAREFKNNKHIQFLIPEGADVHYNIYGHRYMGTHGDNLGVKGGDGIIGALGPIRRGEIKIRTSESVINRDFDTLWMGHWHQYIPLPGLIVNPTLKGFDEFAHLALRAPCAPAAQALWFTHPEHGVTAHWQIFVGERANKPKFEEADQKKFLVSWPSGQ